MKILKNIAGAGAIMTLASMVTVSCIDGNDWETDSSFDRLFSVNSENISVSENATTAEVKWDLSKDAEYYIIEVSKDTLYDAIAMNGENAIVYGEDKSITESPYLLTNLSADTKYFLRIKSMSSIKNESKWAYYTDYSFTTKTEQLFETVSNEDISDKTITLHWTPGADVDYIEITDANGTSIKKVTLDDTAKSEGTVTIDGLNQLTSYTATLYLGETKRGVVTFVTNATVPDADYTVYLAATDSLNNTLFETMSEAGYQTVNIALASGAAYNNDNSIVIPDGMSVTFFGLPGASQAIISVKNIDYAGTHEFIHFENVELNGEHGDYVFNQSVSAHVGEIKFSNSFIHGFKNSPFRMQGSDMKMVNNLTFDNSIIYGASSRSYSLVHIDAGSGNGKVENILFTNSTVVYTGKSFIYCKNTDFTSLKFANCTFSKIIGVGDYFLDCAKNTYGPSNGTSIENCIFGSSSVTPAEGEKINGIRAKGTVEVSNSYATKDMYITNNPIGNLTSYEGGEADLFQNSANYDFTIIDNSFPGKTNCGDPRWYKK